MASIRVAGGGEIQVGKIVCLLRNYRAHAAEMKSAPPKEPYFFLKPSTSIIHNGGTIIIPMQSSNVHHEVELGVVVGKLAKSVPKARAMEHVAAYAVLIDVTARDVQDGAKKESRPWAAAKGFDTFCPISDAVPAAKVPDPHNLGIWLKVNGEFRQRGSTSQMIYDIPTVIEYVSGIMTLEPGDVIATGTPEGVGPIARGDVVEAGIDGVGPLKVKVA
jgi:2-keto-4-pentenoate hydratase/2-oxohepta-3-ene-1,7-dioic acid hydratase in catechol pathway